MKRSFTLLLLFPLLAHAKFVYGEKVPLDRLIENVKAHFPLYENQAEAHYLLGRLESLAFSGKADAVEVINRKHEAQLPQVAFRSWVQDFEAITFIKFQSCQQALR